MAEKNMKKRLLKVAVAVVVVIAIAAFAFLQWVKSQAEDATLPTYRIGDPSIVLAADGKTALGHIASTASGKQLDDKQVSTLIRQAHMGAEDRSFYDHEAISLVATARALLLDLRAGSIIAGGSTISQQYVKNAYLTSAQTGDRKLNEWILAYRLEKDFTKDQILTKYVNSNYYGRGAYGIEDAAQTWFGVSATDIADTKDPLQVARAAFLAALVQRPGAFSDHKGGPPSKLTKADELYKRVNYTLDGMRDLEGVETMVSQDVIDKAKALLPLKLTETVKEPAKGDGDPYLMQYVQDWLTAWQVQQAKDVDGLKDSEAAEQGAATTESMLARGGLKIQLSIDAGLQSTLVDVHKADINHNRPSGAVILNPRDGGVLAMSGGINYRADPVNYAMYASRPPGSTMKPFVLADAVEKGVSPNSVFAAPKYIQIDGPPIWDHTRADAPGCKMTLADALAASNNVVFTEAATGKMASCQDRSKLTGIDGYSVTPKSVASLLRKAGADSSPVPNRDSPAKIGEEPRLAIGGSIELSPLKLAVMGASIANGGTYHKPHVIDAVDLPDGERVFQHEDESSDVMDEDTTRIVAQAMTGVFTHGTAVHDQVDGHPLAGKTGTTDGDPKTQQGDTWMLAFNADNPDADSEPAYVCSVWEGKNPNGSGADTGKVCQGFLSKALRGKAKVDFPEGDLNSGKKVGLKEDPPPPPQTTEQPPAPEPTTEAPPSSSTPTPTKTKEKPTKPATTKSEPPTRSTPPPEQTGGPITGTVPVPGPGNTGNGTGTG
jgi:membrane peptidoglycan carboxypeptidase